MKVLVACEESGRVRDAFLARGHRAVSCDILSTAQPGAHYKGDVRDILYNGWDLLIAHPPCTFLCLSSARWFYDPADKHLPIEHRRPHPNYPNRMADFQAAADFFLLLKNAPIDKICIENSQPLGRTMNLVGRYDQIVQPWMFGEPYTKGAYLWLKGLPMLEPIYKKTDYEAIIPECWNASPGPERAKLRSRTYISIAHNMAMQWG